MTTTSVRASTLVLALLAACGSPSGGDAVSPPATETAAPDPAASRVDDAAPASGLYAFEARSLEGEPVALSDYAGSVTLVVNVASRCGYTPQYAGLEELHRRLTERGFQVIGFPSNEFGGQEPGDAAEIRAFCTENFGVTFPLFEKCLTQPGDGQSPVYDWLEAQTGDVPSWNFCKYLVGRDGAVVGFFGSRVSPDDPQLLDAIETALTSGG